MNKQNTIKQKGNLKLGKETFGDMPIDECFQKALEPYFPGIKVRKSKKKRK